MPPSSSSSDDDSSDSSAFPPTKSGQCGANHGNQQCFTQPGATCCSQKGVCGTGDDFCLPDNGCQSTYGFCKNVAPDEETIRNTVTSFVPLTTAFPSVGGCADRLWQVSKSGITAWDPNYGRYIDKKSPCQPGEVTSWWQASEAETKISLGPLVCPDAYTTAATQYTTIGGKARTMVACCPSDYAYNGFKTAGDASQCSSEVDKGQELRYMTTDSAKSTWAEHTTTLASHSQIWAAPVNGWVFPTASTAVISSSSRLAGINYNQAPTMASAADSSSHSSSGLPTAVSAGIGAGVGAAVIMLVSFIILMHRYMNKRNVDAVEAWQRGLIVPDNELRPEDLGSPSTTKEVVEEPVELEPTRPRAELP